MPFPLQRHIAVRLFDGKINCTDLQFYIKQKMVLFSLFEGIPAVIVGLVAAIRPSSYDMGKSLYKNITCGSLKIATKIERTRYTDITLTTLLLL